MNTFEAERLTSNADCAGAASISSCSCVTHIWFTCIRAHCQIHAQAITWQEVPLDLLT